MHENSGESQGEAPAHAGASLSIGDVAEATGLSVDTLRAWERRYGRPRALRLPSGHRRYTADQVRRLRRVAEGLARGHRPSMLLKATEEGLTRLLTAETEDPDSSTEQLLTLVRDFRRGELVEVLQRDWRALAPRVFLDTRITPLLQAVGRLWADGEMEVRHEHFLTEVLEDTLRSLRLSLPLPATPRAPSLVLATLPGETHGLALQMLALLGALHGVTTHTLGINTPVEEITRTVEETGARAVVLSVSLAQGGVATDRRLQALRERVDEDVAIVVGGGGARGPRRGVRGVEYLEDLKGFEGWLSRHTG